MKKIVLLVAVMMSVAVVVSAKSKVVSDNQKDIVPIVKYEPAVQGNGNTIPPIIIRW